MNAPPGDAVERFRAATEADDLEAMMATLSPDVELVSPLSAHLVFRGQRDVRVLMRTIYGSIRRLRWIEVVGGPDDRLRVLLGDATIQGAVLTDAMVLELDDQGRIRRIRPHLRPWVALSLFALRLLPTVLRRPGMLRRALRR